MSMVPMSSALPCKMRVSRKKAVLWLLSNLLSMHCKTILSICHLSVLLLLLTLPLSSYAKCGSVDYSQGAEALARMHDYVVTMMLYVLYVLYAGAGITAIISALQIYIKMNMGEDGVMKAILTLIGAILFIIGASIVMPAFFGYQIL